MLTPFAMVALLTIGFFVVHAADQSWDGGGTGNGTAWYTLTNWAGDTGFPGSGSVTTNADIATIPSSGTNPTIGINGATNATLYLGAINFTATNNRTIGNSSATSFTLQLNGATVNAVNNVILRNSNTATLTLQNSGGGAGATGIALGNAADNIINIDGSGGITISSIIKNGTGSKLTRGGAGAGTLTLSGVNTYTGDTTINSGRLSLGTTGSIANSPNIVLAGGSTFDVSTLTTALTLASGQGLKATGSTSTGTIATASGKGLTTAANSPLQFTAFNGAIAPLTISGAGTVTLASSNPTTITIANGGTPLAAGDYILIAKGASGSVAGAAPTTLTVNGATADMFREGVGLVSPGANDGEYAFVRKLTTGLPQDSDDNAADFTFVSTNGGLYGSVQSILGAPGPENSDNPIQRNGVIKASLVDGTAASTAPPNRVRSGQVQPGVPNAYGTLSIQRRFKNTTALPVTRLRFRVVDITTLNSPVTGSPQADLRVLSSTGVVTNSQGQEVITVTGLTLETPPTQTNGGGLNSTLTVVLPGDMLAPGNSIDVQFLLGVQEQGSFRFLVNVEALPGLTSSQIPEPEQSNMKRRGLKTNAASPKAQ